MGASDHIKEAQRARKGAAAKQKATDDGWKGFVQCELNEQQKIAVKRLRDENMGQCWTDYLSLTGELYKLSQSYDTYNDAFVVSATCKDPKDKNMGLTLSARGGSLEGAVASFVYKHSIILEGDWTVVGVQGARKVSADDVG